MPPSPQQGLRTPVGHLITVSLITAVITIPTLIEHSDDESSAAPSGDSDDESSAAPSGEGATTIEDIFGPACDQVPTEGEGSAQGMGLDRASWARTDDIRAISTARFARPAPLGRLSDHEAEQVRRWVNRMLA